MNIPAVLKFIGSVVIFTQGISFLTPRPNYAEI